MKFWVPWCMSAGVTAVAIFFFFIGLADGTVSSFNAGLWMLLLGGTFGTTAGSLILQRKGHGKLAIAMALVLAVPGFVAVFLMLLLVVSGPRWN